MSDRTPGEILDGLADAVIALGQDQRVLYWSRQAEAMFGYAAAEVVGRSLPRAIRLQPFRPGLGERRMEVHRRNGARLTVVVSVQPLPGPAGTAQGTVLVVKDLAPWLGELTQPMITEGLDLDERLGATFRPTMEATGADLDPGQGPAPRRPGPEAAAGDRVRRRAGRGRPPRGAPLGGGRRSIRRHAGRPRFPRPGKPRRPRPGHQKGPGDDRDAR